MYIRETRTSDLDDLLELYTQLHDNNTPVIDNSLKQLWDNILADENHHIIVGLVNERIISSCVLIVVPNLTHNQRSYALIENVVTHVDYRNNGYATQLLEYAKKIATNENCYKIMLLTGSKKESTLRFYEKSGYNQNDKTAFIQWLE